MKSYVPLFLFLFFCFSCKQPGQSKPNKLSDDTTVKSKPGSSYTDTIIIKDKTVIFFNPDSLQLKKIKAVTDTVIYTSMLHDCFYQQRNARMHIKKSYPSLKVVETAYARYLLFIMADGKKECIDLDTKNDACGIFLFNKEQPPRLADMTNIDTELGFYFAH